MITLLSYRGTHFFFYAKWVGMFPVYLTFFFLHSFVFQVTEIGKDVIGLRVSALQFR